jgi:hypothetical protein
MRQSVGQYSLSHLSASSLFLAILWCGVPIGFAAEPPTPSSSSPDQPGQPTEAGDIQERGLTNPRPGPSLGGAKMLPPPAQPEGGLPPNLCQPVTRELTQCKCFNQADCQTLTALCPGSCPAGSQSCQCIPLSRGTPPPLPRKLCHYQIQQTFTQCSCHSETDCQLLTNICPGSCPVGSQSCECVPLQRR